MPRFTCDESYKRDMEEYSSEILNNVGIASPIAEREIIYLSDSGNTVAAKLYADLVFHKKIVMRRHLSGAFKLYMKSAGISAAEGEWHGAAKAYPLSYWLLGYYLMNYKKESTLLNCEDIAEIEEMEWQERLKLTLELASSCLCHIEAAGAMNLMGRSLMEIASDKKIFEILQPIVSATLSELTSLIPSLEIPALENIEDCKVAAEIFFLEAAKKGYVYACNSLASKEASNILKLNKNKENVALLGESIEKYAAYLKMSADRYEPYAANRLGLFYETGEVWDGTDSIFFREYINTSKAKEYFKKATVYHDANSAWAYYNLMKFFPKVYERDLDLLNEHMDYIKELNPKVYDLAMEL